MAGDKKPSGWEVWTKKERAEWEKTGQIPMSVYNRGATFDPNAAGPYVGLTSGTRTSTFTDDGTAKTYEQWKRDYLADRDQSPAMGAKPKAPPESVMKAMFEYQRPKDAEKAAADAVAGGTGEAQALANQIATQNPKWTQERINKEVKKQLAAAKAETNSDTASARSGKEGLESFARNVGSGKAEWISTVFPEGNRLDPATLSRVMSQAVDPQTGEPFDPSDPKAVARFEKIIRTKEGAMGIGLDEGTFIAAKNEVEVTTMGSSTGKMKIGEEEVSYRRGGIRVNRAVRQNIREQANLSGTDIDTIIGTASLIGMEGSWQWIAGVTSSVGDIRDENNNVDVEAVNDVGNQLRLYKNRYGSTVLATIAYKYGTAFADQVRASGRIPQNMKEEVMGYVDAATKFTRAPDNAEEGNPYGGNDVDAAREFRALEEQDPEVEHRLDQASVRQAATQMVQTLLMTDNPALVEQIVSRVSAEYTAATREQTPNPFDRYGGSQTVIDQQYDPDAAAQAMIEATPEYQRLYQHAGGKTPQQYQQAFRGTAESVLGGGINSSVENAAIREGMEAGTTELTYGQLIGDESAWQGGSNFRDRVFGLAQVLNREL